MTQEHPITPSEELVQDWLNNMRSDDCIGAYPHDMDLLLATQAARWGADEELQACINWLYENDWKAVQKHLRDARRPKPPSLKEQALDQLRSIQVDLTRCGMGISVETIRRALESLPE